MIIETERLFMRELTQDDYESLCMILQDPAVMYAYEGPFRDDEVQAWIDRQFHRYETDGFGLWAVVLKDSGEMIGQCGITMQEYGGGQVPEIGYLFQKAYWHHGYASEAAVACREYAFTHLGVETVYSIIRDTNIPSQNVAKRNGMTCVAHLVKRYRGVDMPHLLFAVTKPD